MKDKEKVDIVLIWVDGNDKQWQEEKSKYEKKEESENIDSSNKRYRDWDNLKYIFRGIEKYMSWYNNVFFITNGQKPEWLNLNYEKLKWVKHEDYMPKEFLPTFNCNPIELNFHRIKDLSEQFIYFNDDMFVLRELKKEDFFKNGLPCETAVINPVTPQNKNIVNQLWFNNTSLINKYFNKQEVLKKYRGKFLNIKYGKDVLRTIVLSGWKNFLGFKFTHIPTSLLKSTYEEVWNKEEKELTKSSLNKFRAKNDYTQYLMKDWQIASGKFYPRNPKIGKIIQIVEKEDISNAKKLIENQKYKMICINDEIDNDIDFESAKKIINDSFEKILPEKSKFEI